MATHPPSGTSSASRTLPWLLPMTPPVLPHGRSRASFYEHCPVLTKPGPTCRPTLLPGNPSDCKLPACRHEVWQWQPRAHLEKTKSVNGAYPSCQHTGLIPKRTNAYNNSQFSSIAVSSIKNSLAIGATNNNGQCLLHTKKCPSDLTECLSSPLCKAGPCNRQRLNDKGTALATGSVLLERSLQPLPLIHIMKKLYNYIETNYSLTFYGLGILNASKDFIQFKNMKLPEFLSKKESEKIESMKIPVHEDSTGLHSIVFKKKKTRISLFIFF